MRTLVTGARGFIGRRLLRPGDRALVRTRDNRPGFVCGDLLDIPSLEAACAGIECIFHCAGHAHAFASSDAATHWRVNYEGTCNLLAAAGRAGVRKFVFLSSVKAMAEPGDQCRDEDWPGEPTSDYGRAKRAAEAQVLEAGGRHGMHAVCLRLAMVYGRGGRGNLERLARGIRGGWFPPLPDTSNRRSLIHVDDVVMAARLVAEAPAAAGRIYIVAEPRSYSGQEIYAAVRASLGLPPLRWSIPAALLRAGGRLGDGLGALLRRSIPLNSEAVSRLLDSACYSPARIESELGWRARIALAEGLRETLS